MMEACFLYMRVLTQECWVVRTAFFDSVGFVGQDTLWHWRSDTNTSVHTYRHSCWL